MAKIEATNVIARRPSERWLQRQRSCQKLRVETIEKNCMQDYMCNVSFGSFLALTPLKLSTDKLKVCFCTVKPFSFGGKK